jgi:DNA-binding response OmpR family regulator
MTRTQYTLLLLLVAEPTRVFSKAELYLGAWGHDLSCGSDTRTLDTHICRLRKALGGPPWLHNIWGVGYRLLSPAGAMPRIAA